MGVLEDITKMKNEGKGDEEIASELKQRGISPREIEDSFSQARIKNAVSDEDEISSLSPPSSEMYAPPRPSTLEATEEEGNYDSYPQFEQDYEQYPPQKQEYQEYYPEENYEGQSYQPDNTDNIIEISEQIFNEKIGEIKKQLEELKEFKVLFQTKVENSLERLKKIESIIDKLQIAILEKVGSYGENLSDIKKEMLMMQESFKKIADKDIIHHTRSIKSAPSKKHHTPKKKISKKR